MTARRSELLRDLGFYALLAVIVALVFADLITLAGTLHIRDTALFIYPDRHLVWERARSGNFFPMWDFRTSAGQPLAANPGFGVFYPPAWLLPLFSNFNLAFNLFLVGHFLLSGAAMFALLRSLCVSPPAACFGAISWMLGGLMASFACLTLFLYASAWLPLFALYSRRFLISRRVSDFAGAAMTLGVIIIVGEAAMILQAGALLGGYALARALRERSSILRAAGLTAAIIVGGVLVGAVQLFPALELQRESARAAGFPLQWASEWSMRPSRPLELAYPNVFGYFISNGALYWARSAERPAGPPFIFSFYPGLLATALIIAGFVTRARGWKFSAPVVAISYLLAIGEHAPLFQILHAAGLRNVRYPEKFFASAIFILVIFAAMALDDLPRIWKHLASTISAIGVGAVLMFAVSFAPWYRDFFARVWTLGGTAEMFVTESRRGWLFAAMEAAILLALVLVRPRLRPPLWIAALIVFTLGDLAPRLPGIMPRVPVSYYSPPPAATRFPDPAAVRIFSQAQWDYLQHPPTDVPIEMKPWLVRNGLMPRLVTAWGFHAMFEVDVNSTSQKATTELNQMLWTLKGLRRNDRLPLLMALTGVTHIVVPRPFDMNVKPEAIEPVSVIALGNPRYYFADQIITAGSIGEFAAALTSNVQWSRRAAFIPMLSFVPAAGRVVRAVEGDDRIDLAVESGGRALLVVAITPHRHWRATIDGAPSSLIRANGGMQAVEVPLGRHNITMIYRDPVVTASAVVSALTVIALLLAALTSRFAARSRSTIPPPQSQR